MQLHPASRLSQVRADHLEYEFLSWRGGESPVVGERLFQVLQEFAANPSRNSWGWLFFLEQKDCISRLFESNSQTRGDRKLSAVESPRRARW